MDNLDKNPAASVAEQPPLNEKITTLLDALHRPMEGKDQAAYDAHFDAALKEAGITIDSDLTASEVYLAVERAAYNGSADHDGNRVPKQFTFTAHERFGHLLKDEFHGEAFRKAMDTASRYEGPIPVNPYKEKARRTEQAEKLGAFVEAIRKERTSYDKNEMREIVTRALTSVGIPADDPASLLEAWVSLSPIPHHGQDGISGEFSLALWNMIPQEVTTSREVLRVLHDYNGNPRGFLRANPLRQPKTERE